MNKKKAMAFLLVSVMAGSMLAGCGSDASSAHCLLYTSPSPRD